MTFIQDLWCDIIDISLWERVLIKFSKISRNAEIILINKHIMEEIYNGIKN